MSSFTILNTALNTLDTRSLRMYVTTEPRPAVAAVAVARAEYKAIAV